MLRGISHASLTRCILALAITNFVQVAHAQPFDPFQTEPCHNSGEKCAEICNKRWATPDRPPAGTLQYIELSHCLDICTINYNDCYCPKIKQSSCGMPGCANLQSDRHNCGACGTVCSGSTPNCVYGACTLCPKGELDYCGDGTCCGPLGPCDCGD